MSDTNQHYQWVNSLRAVGIVFVVLGHTLGITQTLESYIFSFHMPLFFFLAGVVLTEKRLAQGWQPTLLHYWKRLLVPYLLFSLITYIPWVLLTRHHGADAALDVPAWRPVIGTLYGIGVDGWLQHNAMLWFFPCLFVLHLQFRLLRQFVPGVALAGVLIVAAGGAWLFHSLCGMRLPWGIEVAMMALPFYASGYFLRVRLAAPSLRPGYVFVLIVLLLLVQFWTIELNGRVDMNFISVGNPVFFYVGAFSGIGVWVLASRFFPVSSLLNRIAEASILIFPLHRTIFSVLSGVLVFVFGISTEFKSSGLGSAAYALAAIFTCLLLMPVAHRFGGAFLGGRR